MDHSGITTKTYRGLVLACNHFTGRWTVRSGETPVAFGLANEQAAMLRADAFLAASAEKFSGVQS